jgi:hypothetical protein
MSSLGHRSWLNLRAYPTRHMTPATIQVNVPASCETAVLIFAWQYGHTPVVGNAPKVSPEPSCMTPGWLVTTTVVDTVPAGRGAGKISKLWKTNKCFKIILHISVYILQMFLKCECKCAAKLCLEHKVIKEVCSSIVQHTFPKQNISAV